MAEQPKGGALPHEQDAKTLGPGPKDDKTAPKKAEKVEAKKVDKESPDGDTDDLTKYAEPKGTVHKDQYTTNFPGERTGR